MTDVGIDTQMLAVNRALRLKAMNLKVDGVPFQLKPYYYLVDILNEESQRVTIRKGAQLGFTVAMVLCVLDKSRYKYPRGVLYLMPTRDDVSDFSKSRFDRMMKENPTTLGGWVSGTDSTNIKKIGNAFVYFRGAKSRSQLKAIPVDCLIEDERDEMDPVMVELAQKRLDGSTIRDEFDLSTPTLPDYGVDLNYKVSDQRVWKIKCKACGGWTCMELDWPKSMLRDKDGIVRRACIKCEAEIYVWDGEWVAAFPERDHHGYWISQLCSPTVPPNVILDEFEGGMVDTQEFYNSRLGLGYADLEDVLDEQTLRERCTEHPRSLSSPGTCYLGADIGKQDIHYVVGLKHSEVDHEILDYGVIPGFNELHDKLQRFHVGVAVLDGMAETRKVREFLGRNTQAWECWYSEAQRTGYNWGLKDRRVTVNRTELLDQSHRAVIQRQVRLPRPDDRWGEFVKQMSNLARVTVRDEKTGIPRVRWIIRGGRKNDHFRHAFAYAMLAAEQCPVATKTQRARTYNEPETRGAGWMSV